LHTRPYFLQFYKTLELIQKQFCDTRNLVHRIISNQWLAPTPMRMMVVVSWCARAATHFAANDWNDIPEYAPNCTHIDKAILPKARSNHDKLKPNEIGICAV
jgi:hypothetical protein